MTQQEVQDQLDWDLEFYGSAYYTVDCQGNKTRIDPLALVSIKRQMSREQCPKSSGENPGIEEGGPMTPEEEAAWKAKYIK